MISLLIVSFLLFDIACTPSSTFNATIGSSSPLRGLTEQILQNLLGENAQHVISITVGGQELRVKLTTSFCGLWLYNNATVNKGFNSNLSKTFLGTTIQDKMEFVSGNVAYDCFQLDDAVAEHLPFLLVDEADPSVKRFYYDGIIGYGFHCEEHLSRVDLFGYQSRNNLTLSDVVSFILYANSTKGFFDAGAYPPKLHLFPKFYRRAKVSNPDRTVQWSIALDSVYLQDYTYHRVKDYVSIGINGNLISVKKDFLDWFVQTFFAKLIQNGKCLYKKDVVYEVYCDPDADLPQIGLITFIVGKWNFKVDGNQLVKGVTRDGCKKVWYALVHYPEHSQYYIPQNYLKGIYIVYDKKKQEVGFMFRPQRKSDHSVID